ncbi:MAG: hypothetical protein LBV76_01395, partial [Deltaproteobacteria bacterium]|nr:hypothetical protein [Deltaproteobacteria bacterium]
MVMGNNKRTLWQTPWQFKESAMVVFGIILVGLALQLSLGHFNFFFLHRPGNVIILVLFGLCIALGASLRKTPFVLWLSGLPLATCLIGGLLLFSLIMGLTPQVERIDPNAQGALSALGFTRVTTAWPFVLLYAFIIVALGITIVRRLFRFSIKDYVFYFNHIGLWVLLVSAGLGAADIQRLVMHVREGETEWRVYGPNG